MICVLRGIQLNLLIINGSGSGTSGRATAFGLGRLGLNPRTDLGFFSSELLSICSCWVLGFFNQGVTER